MKKLQDPDYKPDENTKSEIERLHREGESLSGLQLSFADLKNANLVDADLESCDLKRANLFIPFINAKNNFVHVS